MEKVQKIKLSAEERKEKTKEYQKLYRELNKKQAPPKGPKSEEELEQLKIKKKEAFKISHKKCMDKLKLTEKHVENRQQHNQTYYEKNAEKLRAQGREYSKAYYLKHREERINKTREYQHQKQEELMTLMGGLNLLI